MYINKYYQCNRWGQDRRRTFRMVYQENWFHKEDYMILSSRNSLCQHRSPQKQTVLKSLYCCMLHLTFLPLPLLQHLHLSVLQLPTNKMKKIQNQRYLIWWDACKLCVPVIMRKRISQGRRVITFTKRVCFIILWSVADWICNVRMDGRSV